MLPNNNSQFAPWLSPLKVGMKVLIKTEPQPKDNPKLKSPFYCEVDFGGTTYSVGLNWTSYGYISRHQAFGQDTKDWVGKEIIYKGMEKTKKGSQAHVWMAVEPIVTLDNGVKVPF